MRDHYGEKRLNLFADLLDIPRSYYEKAAKRHRSLQDWFCRPESKLAIYNPTVYPQGSFRLGTVIRPLFADDEYDLDVVCELLLLTKQKMTQQELKRLVGEEVKAYAQAHNILEPVLERKRCWRLDYSDDVNFHIDILGCCPEDPASVLRLVVRGVDRGLAATAIALTCTKSPTFAQLSNDWPTSNPAGYGRWFENRMGAVRLWRQGELVAAGEYRKIEEVPTHALKTPLQRSIQLLKRHRDVMFQDDCDMKPISMVITTLASKAYAGEDSLEHALFGILSRMKEHISPTEPRVPNPVNPDEDFADKWRDTPELEDNFNLWHEQACRDFRSLLEAASADRLKKDARSVLDLGVNEDDARRLVPESVCRIAVAAPAVVVARSAPSPWKDHAR